MPTLDWTGKADAIKAAQNVPYRLLEFDKTLSCGEGENLIVQGDNLDVLKSLLPIYRGRVKCIYIDPPYNTGAAFEHYDDNLEHSTWLCMMYPRLELLREFLTDDGAIFISIDDNEQAHLKLICDEIFGMKNFVATVVWQKIHSIKNDAKYLSQSHDYILVYALDKEKINFNLLPRTEEMNARYKNPDNDPRGAWQSGDLVANEERTNGYYEVISPTTGKIFNVPRGKHWVYSKENLEQMIADNRIWFGKDGNSFPRKKRFLSEVMDGRKGDTWWTSDEVGHNQESKREVIKIFGDKNIFDFPKPTRLIEKILRLATDKDSLILDAFAGSGTTAHAVINLNAADSGNRKFILIEEKDYCETITAERVKRVGGTFNFYRLGTRLFDATGALNQAVTFGQLAAYIWFKFTGMPYVKKTPPLIGIHNGAAYYLIDKTLTRKILETLPAHDGAKIIFGTASRIDAEDLKSLNATFRQIPKDIR